MVVKWKLFLLKECGKWYNGFIEEAWNKGMEGVVEDEWTDTSWKSSFCDPHFGTWTTSRGDT